MPNRFPRARTCFNCQNEPETFYTIAIKSRGICFLCPECYWNWRKKKVAGELAP